MTGLVRHCGRDAGFGSAFERLVLTQRGHKLSQFSGSFGVWARALMRRKCCTPAPKVQYHRLGWEDSLIKELDSTGDR